MFWEADFRRAAYDPETISMLSTVLERVVAALPDEDRTDERKTRLASSIRQGRARPHSPLRDGARKGACDWRSTHIPAPQVTSAVIAHAPQRCPSPVSRDREPL